MTQELEFESPRSWEAARSYASLYGEVPNSFATLVRSLVQDHAKNPGTLSDGSRFQLLRLMRGPSIRAILYYAALCYREDRVSKDREPSENELASLFYPIDLASIIAVTYLYRTARKRTVPDEWGTLAQALHPRVEMAGLVGASMPSIGFYRGLLAATLPTLAQAAFLKHDVKGFVEYRRLNKRTNEDMNPEFELKRWGCTVIQVASILLQAVGFGVDLAGKLTRAFSPTIDLASLETESYRFRIAVVWADALLRTGGAPDMAHRGEFYPLAHELQRLLGRAGEVRSRGCTYLWLEKGKEDLLSSSDGN